MNFESADALRDAFKKMMEQQHQMTTRDYVKKKLFDLGETRPFLCNIVGKSQEGFWEAAGYDNQISTLDIQDVVRLDIRHVPFDEIATIFATTDIAVVPYVNASQSAVVPLAYAFSKPVIASEVGGIPDVVVHGVTGVLVEPGNVEELAEKIVFFIQNPKSAIGMGRNARKFADTELSWETIANKTIDCYNLNNS
jgi:glycosyltransferase involved in cell wall biosynthesis